MKTAEEILKLQLIEDGYTEADYEKHVKYAKHSITRAMKKYAEQWRRNAFVSGKDQGAFGNPPIYDNYFDYEQSNPLK